ncbi:class F sortase [Streptomyces sp. QL37]|uniref:class F sortase n=1 Tax=Streptomyces sp. QL37 TaxID=2093747 RepID=UPI000CF1D92F|nr:class F sortase [Streptomyces sp. QL37]PPQ61795.1 class F sortase [Streptomyces sp. QL37]
MESGSTNNTATPSFPAVKHLVWALVAGTALVISGTRDDRPPQPPAAATAAPAAAPSAAAAPPTTRPTGPAQALAYLAPERPAPRPPSYMRSPAMAPAPAAPPPVRPGPLAPVPVSRPEQAPARPASTKPAPGGAASHPSVQPLPPATPLRLRIPALKVDAPMMKLALNKAGALEPPPDNNPVLAGWYAGGTVPGAVGTAVAAGHVDTRLGPGVFHELGSVRKGATIEIVRADGRTAVFTVYAVEVYDKTNFPDGKVYGPSARPELRVITCGGAYNKKTGYQDNVVVFASMTASR